MSIGKRISVEIELTNPMTDKQVLACLKGCSGVYKKMEDVLDRFRGKSHSPLADKLVDFIFHYRDGQIAPDKWDYYEPVRQVVDAQTKGLLKSALSQRCWIVLKRTRTPAMSCLIINEELPNLTPTVDLIDRSSGSSISFFPDRRRKFVVEDWYVLLQDLCRELETDYGYICDLDTKEIYADIFSTPYHERIGRTKEAILGARRMYDTVHEFMHSPYPTLGWHSSYFYPILDKSVNNEFRMGLYALDLLKDTLISEGIDSLSYGLRLDFDRSIADIEGIQWDNPANYAGSLVFLSRHNVFESIQYSKDNIIVQVHCERSVILSRFSKVYLKENKEDKRDRSLLLIP